LPERWSSAAPRRHWRKLFRTIFSFCSSAPNQRNRFDHSSEASMAAKKFDPLELQHNVKRNASDIQDFIADLGSWEDGIKTKDKKLLKVLRDLAERNCGQRDRGRERARASKRGREGEAEGQRVLRVF